jgi:ABC-type sugar transport system ATPase subunit
MTPGTLLELIGVSKQFPGVLALDGVDLALFPGEIHALVGENGAGKSTLIKIITGVYVADKGMITVGGRETRIGTPRSPAKAASRWCRRTFSWRPKCRSAGTSYSAWRIGPLR